MTVLCMCNYSAYCTICCPKCYTGKVVIVFLTPSSVIKHALELEARELHIDEGGFNLDLERNRIGQRATIDVQGQRGGNITTKATEINCDLINPVTNISHLKTKRKKKKMFKENEGSHTALFTFFDN